MVALEFQRTIFTLNSKFAAKVAALSSEWKGILESTKRGRAAPSLQISIFIVVSLVVDCLNCIIRLTEPI